MADQEDLEKFRSAIDATDREIVRLILERARLAREVGASKKKSGTTVYRPDREKIIYENIRRYAQELSGAESVLPVAVLEHVYREIMSGSIAIEGGPTVAYLGPPASFSHLATRFRFGQAVNALPVGTVHEVFRAVERGSEAQFGVVPADNTTEGAIGITLDKFLVSDLKIYAEHYLRVQHCLLFPGQTELKEIRRLYGLKTANEQCREWTNANLNTARLEYVETPSTAAAARAAAENKDGAAIASSLAAETYGLTILKSGIQDNPNNVTRFFVVGREQVQPTGDDKTSIIVAVPGSDQPGSLFRLLEPFQKKKINLTRIESRATRRTFGEYNFFLDFEGHAADPMIRRVLKRVAESSSFLKVLGSYPRMDLPLP